MFSVLGLLAFATNIWAACQLRVDGTQSDRMGLYASTD